LQGLSRLQKRQPYCVLQPVILEHLRTIRSDEWPSFGTVCSNSNKLNFDFVKDNGNTADCSYFGFVINYFLFDCPQY
jgi:hypothetical protein